MTDAATVPIYDAPRPDEPIRALLRRRLLALSYHAFVQCLCRLLTYLGYEDIQLAGRTRWKGRNREGGYDIEACLPDACLSDSCRRRRVVVQAKQYDALPVFQRSVDELRGACLRAGAAEALLITTSTFSSVVRQNNITKNTAHIGPQVAPVRLLDGEDLLDLLLRHRIGVREVPGGASDAMPRLTIDTAFFEALSRDFAGSARRPKSISSSSFSKSAPRQGHRSRLGYKNGDGDSAGAACWLLTVRVGSAGLFGGRRGAGGKTTEERQ